MRHPNEAEDQKALVQWLRVKKIRHFSVPNENQGSFLNKKVAMIQERKAQSMGKLKGAPDLFIWTRDKIIAIELKRQIKTLKDGSPSKTIPKTSREQIEAITWINEFDYAEARICYGWMKAKEFIEKYI